MLHRKEDEDESGSERRREPRLRSPTSRIGSSAIVAIGVAGAVAWCPQSSVMGQELADESSRFVLEASLDVSSRYLFRGHEKDERGAVLQPEIGLGFKLLSSSSGTVRELSVGALLWSSVHAGTRGYPDDLGVFEVDLGLSLDAALSNGWTVGLIYTSYLAPTDAFDTIHEIGIGLDLGALGREGVLTFSPSVLLAQEVHDTGGTEDTYLEVGGDFALPQTGVVRWAVPVTVGMSVDGFYRDASGGNEWFGFLGSGIEASASLLDLGLGRLPGTLTAGVNLAFVNRDAELTRDPSNDLLWTTRVGLSIGL